MNNTRKTIKIGTDHYVSAYQAKRAYGDDYDNAIEEGRIHVGIPPLKPGQWTYIDGEGRYFIVEWDE